MTKAPRKYIGDSFGAFMSKPGLSPLLIPAILRSPAHYKMAGERFDATKFIMQGAPLAVELLKQMLAHDEADALQVAGLLYNSSGFAQSQKETLGKLFAAIKATPQWTAYEAAGLEYNVCRLWPLAPGLKSRWDVLVGPPGEARILRFVLLPDIGKVDDMLSMDNYRLADAADALIAGHLGLKAKIVWVCMEAAADCWTPRGSTHEVCFVETTPRIEDVGRVGEALGTLERCLKEDKWPMGPTMMDRPRLG